MLWAQSFPQSTYILQTSPTWSLVFTTPSFRQNISRRNLLVYAPQVSYTLCQANQELLGGLGIRVQSWESWKREREKGSKHHHATGQNGVYREVCSLGAPKEVGNSRCKMTEFLRTGQQRHPVLLGPVVGGLIQEMGAQLGAQEVSDQEAWAETSCLLLFAWGEFKGSRRGSGEKEIYLACCSSVSFPFPVRVLSGSVFTSLWRLLTWAQCSGSLKSEEVSDSALLPGSCIGCHPYTV